MIIMSFLLPPVVRAPPPPNVPTWMFDWILMRVQPVHPEDGLVDRLATLRIRHLHLHQNNKQIFNWIEHVFAETSVPDTHLFWGGAP